MHYFHRYLDVLYYGCANATLGGTVYKFCATSRDSDFNADQIGWCNDLCHVQCELLGVSALYFVSQGTLCFLLYYAFWNGKIYTFTFFLVNDA